MYHFKRTNRILTIVLALFMIILLIQEWTDIHYIMFISMLMLYIYMIALVLLVEWILLHIWEKGWPHLPFGLELFNGNKKGLDLLLLIVCGITAIREGMFAPYLTYDLRYVSNRSSIQTQTTTSTAFGKRQNLRLARRYINCQTITCSPELAICKGFRNEFYCDSDRKPNKKNLNYISICRLQELKIHQTIRHCIRSTPCIFRHI